jgi:DNA-binding CsgD family transcriptional regulator
MNKGRSADRRSGRERRRDLSEGRESTERRSGFDRRDAASLPGSSGRSYIPRSLSDRRSGQDRRARAGHGFGAERRSGRDRRAWAERRDNEAVGGPIATRILDEKGALLVELVSDIYDASMDRRPWPQVLSTLANAVGAATCAIAVRDYETETGRLEHFTKLGTRYVRSYEEQYAYLDVWLQREERFQTPGAIWTSQQIVPDDELVTTEYYRDWLAPQDLLHHLFGVLDRRGSVVSYLVFGRSEDAGPFGENEITLLRLLLPKMRRGFRAGQAFRKAQDAQRIAMGALDAMPMGVVLLSGRGAVIGANETARAIIDAGETLSIAEGGLWVDWGWRKLRFSDLVSRLTAKRGGSRAEAVPAFSVPRSSGRKPLSILLMPVGEWDESEAEDKPVAIVFVGDPDRAAEMDPARICQLYGLSRAEARVVALLASGNRLDSVAETLGVTYDTVRKHLKQVFGKTGTDRQAELVRLLVTGPAGLRL